MMRYAWPLGTTDFSDPSKRIAASPDARAVCGCCGREVVSKQFNGVWQWAHMRRANAMKPKRGDRYTNGAGLVAELCVPMIVTEDDIDDDGNAPARFGWGAFLIVDGERVATIGRLYAEQGKSYDDEETAAAEGDRVLRLLGFTQ